MRYCILGVVCDVMRNCWNARLVCMPLFLPLSVCLLVSLSCFFYIRQTSVSVFRDDAGMRSRYVAMTTREVTLSSLFMASQLHLYYSSVWALHSSACSRRNVLEHQRMNLYHTSGADVQFVHHHCPAGTVAKLAAKNSDYAQCQCIKFKDNHVFNSLNSPSHI